MPYLKLSTCFVRMAVLALLLSQGCTRERDTDHSGTAQKVSRVQKTQEGPDCRQVGTASWYGPGFHGKETASGEIFDQNDLTAAHRTLPLGTEVEVTNLKSGKSVEVEITDRGPYVGKRAIDLSRKAAKEIDMKEKGTAKVEIEANSVPGKTGSETVSCAETNVKEKNSRQ